MKNKLLFNSFRYATSFDRFLTYEVNKNTTKPTHKIPIVVPIVNLTSLSSAFFPFTITVSNYVMHTVINVAPESMIPTAKLPFKGYIASQLYSNIIGTNGTKKKPNANAFAYTMVIFFVSTDKSNNPLNKSDTAIKNIQFNF